MQTTRVEVKPKQRSRIIDRANQRCERCGKPAAVCKTGMHVGHIVSQEEGRKFGLSVEQINSDENLIAECDECNSGHGKGCLPLRNYIAILAARTKNAANQDD